MRGPLKTKQYQDRRITALLLIVCVILFCGACGIAAYLLWHKPTRHPTANEMTKGEPAQTPTQTQGSNSTTKSGAVSQTNQPVLAPLGDFVSDHHPNLSGSPAPNLINSTCTTTPGATCQIEFTKDGVTKKLPSEVTDEGGSAYWSWKLQDINLTAGSWQIKAIAVLGGSTKTTVDALPLEVSP